MENPKTLTVPVARQVFLQSFHLSQGDPILQHDLLRYVAVCRPNWRLDGECSQTLLQLPSTIHELVAHGIHFEFTRKNEVENELVNMVDVMHTVFERPRADRSELLISIIRNFIWRDWRFLCYFPGRPRRGGKPSAIHHDPYLSFFCHYVLLGKQTGVRVFDELLTEMREAVASRSAVYEAALDVPSLNLCLTQMIAIYNEKHPDRHVPRSGGVLDEEERESEVHMPLPGAELPTD